MQVCLWSSVWHSAGVGQYSTQFLSPSAYWHLGRQVWRTKHTWASCSQISIKPWYSVFAHRNYLLFKIYKLEHKAGKFKCRQHWNYYGGAYTTQTACTFARRIFLQFISENVLRGPHDKVSFAPFQSQRLSAMWKTDEFAQSTLGIVITSCK